MKPTALLLLVPVLLAAGIFAWRVHESKAPRGAKVTTEGTAGAGIDGRPAHAPRRGGPGERSHPPGRTPVPLTDPRLQVTFGASLGRMDPLLGINAGPVPSGEPGNADLTEAYRWLGVREVRTQDFYGPLDLSVMYPDLDADPSLPSSFVFPESDRVFQSILDGGFVPYLRLGDSYNDARVPGSSREVGRYTEAALEVVRHYCGGAMGPCGYVEIGNEPDNQRFWPGDFDDYLDWYVATFRGIRARWPTLKVGGPGFVVSSYKVPGQRRNVTVFLDRLQEEKIRPDFLSFHLYSNDPGEFYDMVRFYRDEAVRHGLDGVDLHVSEWNTEAGGVESRLGRRAAPTVTACWIALQQAGADASLLFRGADTNVDNPGFYGIFTADGQKKPEAWAFWLWSRMAAYPERIQVVTGVPSLDAPPDLTSDLQPLWWLAGRDPSGHSALLVANLGDREVDLDVAWPEPRTGLEVWEIADPRAGAVRIQPRADGPLKIAPLSVRLLQQVAPEAVDPPSP